MPTRSRAWRHLQGFSGRTVEKTLVMNMASLGITADNLERVALGPVLTDGRLALLVISDDTFSDARLNQVLLFEIVSPPFR